MKDNYTQVYYHIVWSTKCREDFITSTIERRLYDYMGRKCQQLGSEVFAINGTSNHVHLAGTIPPKISASEFIQRVKRSSSHYIANLPDSIWNTLVWQAGYSIFSYARKDLPGVVQYVLNQKQRHQSGDLWESLEPQG